MSTASPAPDDQSKDAAIGRVTRNFMFSVMSMALATPLNVIGMLVMARRLGKESVGLCFSVFAIAIVVFILSGGGVATILTARVARDLQGHRRHISEAGGVLLLAWLVSMIAMLLSGIGYSLLKGIPIQWGMFFLAGIAVVGRHLMEFAVAALRGLERFEFETLTRIIQNGSFFLLVLVTVFPGPRGPLAAVAAFAVSHLLAGAFAVLVVSLGFGCRGIRLTKPIAADWLRESLPLGFGDAVRGMGWHIDTIMLSVLGSNALAGLYNVAYRPLMPLRIVPRTLVSVTFPMMNRLAKDNPGELRRTFARSMTVLWFASLPVCIGVTACAAPIVILLAGPDFKEAITPLRLLIWIAVSLFMTTQFRFLLTAVGAQRVFTRLVIAVLIIKFLLLAALIPVFGLYGACASSLIGETFFVVAGLAVCRRLGLGELEYSRLLRTLPGAAAMGLMTYVASGWSWPWLAVATVLGTVVYVLLCLALRVFHEQEMQRLLRVLRARLPGAGRRPATDPS